MIKTLKRKSSGRLAFTVYAALAVSSSVIAAGLEDFERILLPVMTVETPGAFGSIWITEFAAHNSANEPAQFTIYGFQCQVPCVPRYNRGLLPGETYRGYSWVANGGGEPPGVLVYAEKKHSDDLTLALRVRDLSRSPSSWGTEIPVVRESEFRSGAIQLPNVPLDEAFRQTLRIYDPDARGDSRVQVRVFSLSGAAQRPLAEIEVDLNVPADNEYIPKWHYRPGYAEVYWIQNAFPQLAGVDAVRIEIRPLTNGLRYWAFVSITNNDTQDVTLVTPQ